MYEINCPKCEKEINVESEDLPERACDDGDIDCPHCEHSFKFGWIAELETR